MESGLVGLVGLVCFLNGNGFAIMHIIFGCGIGSLFQLEWFRDDALAFALYSHVVGFVCFLKGILSR